jgi:hypothetical protein
MGAALIIMSFSRLHFRENMKIISKQSKIKEKICDNCKMKKKCGDLPGFCVLIYLVPVALVVVGLVYLLITMEL